MRKDEKNLNFLNIINYPKKNFYDCIILAVGHKDFVEMGSKLIKSFCNKKGFLFDLKYSFRNSKANNYFRI